MTRDIGAKGAFDEVTEESAREMLTSDLLVLWVSFLHAAYDLDQDDDGGDIEDVLSESEEGSEALRAMRVVRDEINRRVPCPSAVTRERVSEAIDEVIASARRKVGGNGSN
jgi:hypothetical protein